MSYQLVNIKKLQFGQWVYINSAIDFVIKLD